MLERMIGSPQPALLASMEAVAARLAGTTCAALFRDPAQWVGQLRGAARVIGCRTLMVGRSPWIAAEALGRSVNWEGEPTGTGGQQAPVRGESERWLALLATLERLTADPARGAVVAVLPGPGVVGRAFGSEPDAAFLGMLKPALLPLVEEICRRRPDLLLIEEADAFDDAVPGTAYRRLFGTLRNLARYYNVALGIGASTDGSPVTEALSALQPDVLLPGAASSGALPELKDLARCAGALQLVGVTVDLSDPVRTRDRVEEARRTLTAGRWCVYSAAELGRDVDLGGIRALVAALETR